ncbi:MAG: AsnC family transcriptional regulator [Burkholderiales bacterium]|nr:AsnC family transcriptional regulator [Burkholderiales bacterium]
MNAPTPPTVLDPIDRAIVVATQSGLPLTSRPYHAIGRTLGVPADEVMRRVERMRALGLIRRIGVVPNHYAIGYTANGMTVWDVDDARVDALGDLVGALDAVSHCYRRPRHLPDWPYNLFAMVHGRSRDEADAKVREIRTILGDACRASEILYSVRILKKAGLRLAHHAGAPPAPITAV